MNRPAKVLLLAIMVLALLVPTSALGSSPVTRTSGDVRVRLWQYFPDDSGTFLYRYRWSATSSLGEGAKGSLTLTVAKELEDGKVQRLSEESWPITEISRLSGNSVEFRAPGSRNYDPEWGGTVWRATDGGRSGDAFSSYCDIHSVEQEVWHSIGTPKQITVR